MNRLANRFHIDVPDFLSGLLRWIIKNLIVLTVSGIALFVSAGRLDWGEGWLYIMMLVIIQLCNAAVLLPASPDYLAELSAMRAGTKTWDRFLSVAVALVGPLAMWVVAGLDKRYGWSLPVDPWVIALGLVLALAGGLYSLWAMSANRFFAATVRLQPERGQRVVNTGPYAVVRHPGYLGDLIFYLVTPFALGSSWTFVPAFVTIALLVLRTILEDRTLSKELTGYAAYTRQVPYRLIPGIW